MKETDRTANGSQIDLLIRYRRTAILSIVCACISGIFILFVASELQSFLIQIEMKLSHEITYCMSISNNLNRQLGRLQTSKLRFAGTVPRQNRQVEPIQAEVFAPHVQRPPLPNRFRTRQLYYPEQQFNAQDQYREAAPVQTQPQNDAQCCTCHQGRAGPAGSPGYPGRDGRDGRPGSPGNAPFAANNPYGAQQQPESCQICQRARPGPRGYPGPRGPKGYPGTPGITAIIGSVALPGYPGPRGPRGYAGGPGAKGYPGDPGQLRQSSFDPYGTSFGPAGLPGLPGPKGDAGYDGLDGKGPYPGARGYPGDRGDVGPTAYDGGIGQPGRPGYPGAEGDCNYCDFTKFEPGYESLPAELPASVPQPTYPRTQPSYQEAPPQPAIQAIVPVNQPQYRRHN